MPACKIVGKTGGFLFKVFSKISHEQPKAEEVKLL
jgi:hypothetical protein